MKKVSLYFILFFAIGIAKTSSSQKDQLGNWLMYLGTFDLPINNLSLHTEYQFRMFDLYSQHQQSFPRLGLNYNFKDNQILTMGVARIHTNDFNEPFNVDPSIENRIWQQYILRHNIWDINIEERSRLEQRWIHNNGATNYLNRVRHRILLKYNMSRRFFLCAYDELFMNLKTNPFDQNRLYAAFGYNFNKSFNLQAGYLRHTTPDGGFNRLQFLLTVNIKKPSEDIMLKPIIYLYPEETQNIEVELDYDGEVTHTYPKYNNGWKVKAEPDGTLFDENNKEYYALYWEGIPNKDYSIKEGFVVAGEETIGFLEDALSKLGLNRKEANEFIIYWLPKMENNPYNMIHFSTTQYEEIAKLKIKPEPESIIRIMMVFKPLDYPIKIKKQNLNSLGKERKGYTIVEWGGHPLPRSYSLDL